MFKERFNYWLKKKKISQEQLSHTTGIPKGSIANYAAGNCRPKNGRIVILADALGLHPNELWPGFMPVVEQNENGLVITSENERKLIEGFRDLNYDTQLKVIACVRSGSPNCLSPMSHGESHLTEKKSA